MSKRRSDRRRGRDRSSDRYPDSRVRRDVSPLDTFMRWDWASRFPSSFVDPLLDVVPLEVEDRRLWRPDLRPARTALGAFARYEVPPYRPPPRSAAVGPRSGLPGHLFFPPSSVSFSNPRRVLVCSRRQERREVLHALGVAGRGSGSFKPRKRSEFSDVSCRRR